MPTAAAVELLAAQRAGIDVGIAIGARRNDANADRGHVAGFSSRGLAFDGSVKPDVAAPGVALATSEPGAATDGSPLYGTVNGTSGAAATVAGAAALLAQMRPALDGAGARRACSSATRSAAARRPSTVGAGTFRLGASAVGEVAAQPATLGFGIWEGPRWHATRTVIVRNVSTRRLQLSLSAVADGESEALQFTVVPDRLVLAHRPLARRCRSRVTAPAAPRARMITGAMQVAAAGSETLRVPWALSFRRYSGEPRSPRVTISEPSFKPSDTNPAVLTVQAGNLVRDDGLQIQPVSRLDVLLYTATGRFVGVIARLRNLLPGLVQLRDHRPRPDERRSSRPAAYELRLAAWPTLPLDAKPSRAQVSLPDRVDSAADGHRGPRVASSREPVRARAAAASARSPTRSGSTIASSRCCSSARRPSRSRSRRRWTTGRCARSPATASRTTSRAARRRAASATTRTSRSTR